MSTSTLTLTIQIELMPLAIRKARSVKLYIPLTVRRTLIKFWKKILAYYVIIRLFLSVKEKETRKYNESCQMYPHSQCMLVR